MSAGKGDKLRKGANLKAYWNNYDAVFGRKSAKKTPGPPEGWEIVNKNDPRLDCLPCRPMTLVPGDEKWSKSVYRKGERVGPGRNWFYALPVAELPKAASLDQALQLLRRCRDSAGRMDLDLYNEIQEFLHENS